MLLRLLSNQRLVAILSFLATLVIAFSLFSRAAHGAVPDADAPDPPPALAVDAGPVTAPIVSPPSAAPPPPASQIPDPEQSPATFVDAFLAWWRNGGKVPAVLVVVIGLMSVLRRRVAWLGVGWRATAVTLATVLLATLLDTWLSVGAAGNLWTWLLGGVGAVIGYLVVPRPGLSDDPDGGSQGRIRPLSA